MKRLHSPEYKVGIVSYPCLSSCSTGTLGLLVASFWGELQSFNTRNGIIPPIVADDTHIQISWNTRLFTFVYRSFSIFSHCYSSLDARHLFGVPSLSLVVLFTGWLLCIIELPIILHHDKSVIWHKLPLHAQYLFFRRLRRGNKRCCKTLL